MLKRSNKVTQEMELSEEMTVTKNYQVQEEQEEDFQHECDSSFNAKNTSVIIEEEGEKKSNASEGSVMEYMQGLVTSVDHQDIDFEMVESLLLDGADINFIAEDTGQCVMHEVAANWDTEVAEFFVSKGANIKMKDNNGRTPLHIAASSNHVKIMEWLLDHEADIEAETFQELQTPFHYAARYNSVEALELLFDKGGNQEVQDYQGRTPLHLASELDRTSAADTLISLPEPAEVRVQDNIGNIAIASMTRTMPGVVSSALDQLYRVSSPARKQYFILSHLEPDIENHGQGVKTPFEVAVEEKQRQVLSHKVMQTLIAEKWMYMRWLFYFHLIFNVIFIAVWSLLIAYPSAQQKHNYVFPKDSWRVVIGVIGIILYICEVMIQTVEMTRSIFKHRVYIRSYSQTIRDDLTKSTQTEDEKHYLRTKLNDLSKSWPTYFRDPWNLIDFVSNVLLFVVIILHIADMANHSARLALWVARVSCLAIITMWLRLFKFGRGFRALGALIAIIGELIGDIFRFFTLYAIIFVPYFICFWVMFGGDQSTSLSAENREDLTSFHRVAIMVFRMSLIDDYPYSSMRDLDEVMAAILVTTVLLFLAVVALNLFIALLSDTFQRVYDNAQANSLLEQARIIHFYEETLPSKMHTLYLKHIHTDCNPLEKFYDDDEDDDEERPAELKKIAHQINDKMLEFTETTRSTELEVVCSAISNRVDELDSRIQFMTQQLEAIQIVLEKNVIEQQQMDSTKATGHGLVRPGTREGPIQPGTREGPIQSVLDSSQRGKTKTINFRPLSSSSSQGKSNVSLQADISKKKLKKSVIQLLPSDTESGMGSPKLTPPQHKSYYSQYSVTPKAVGRFQRQETIAQLVPTHRRVKKNPKELEEEFQWEKKLRPYSKTAWRVRF